MQATRLLGIIVSDHHQCEPSRERFGATSSEESAGCLIRFDREMPPLPYSCAGS